MAGHAPPGRRLNNPTDRMQIVGYLEAYVDHALVGWALDAARPGHRLLLCVEIEGEPSAVGLANLERGDVAQAGHGDGRCGFRIHVQLPPGCRFVIRDAEAGAILFTQDHLGSTSVTTDDGDADARAPVEGNVDTADGTMISGWCRVLAHPDARPEVEALVDGHVVARTIANELRGDLVNAGIGDGNHAFNLRMPYWMLDGTSRQVEVKTQGVTLPGSPVRFFGLPSGGRPLVQMLLEAVPAPDAEMRRTAAMLDCYLQQMELVHPRSVGFSYYEAWLAAQLAGHPGADATPPASADGKGASVRLRDQEGNTYILIIDEGVTALPHAITSLVGAIADADAVYADAQVPLDGALYPWFRPDWSYDLCLAQDYTRGIALFREKALPDLQGLETLAGLRVAALLNCGAGRIRHVTEVVCTLDRPATAAATADVTRAVATHLARRAPGASATMLDDQNGLRRITWPLPTEQPLVSLLIPTRDRLELLRTAVDSIIQRTRYDRFEIIVIDNQSREPETLAWLRDAEQKGRLEVLRYDAPFNFAAMNNLAASRASGDILGFINNDVELISPEWLETAVSLLARPEVGAVGARLRFANGMIQHGGVVMGTGGLAENAFQQVHVDDPGYFHRTRVAGNYSAVTAACLFCHRAEFLALGGFDADNLPVAFNDVDFCLRLRQHGRQIVWSPDIELYHYESVSRGRDNTPEKRARAMKEELHMRRRWGRQALLDPFYNPNLNLDGAPFTGLAVPPRHRWGTSS